MERTRLGRHAEAVGNGLAVLDGTDRATPTQVTVNHLGDRAIKLWHTCGNVTMRCTMETVTSDTQVGRPFVWNAVDLARHWNRLVECRLERSHLWDGWQLLGEGFMTLCTFDPLPLSFTQLWWGPVWPLGLQLPS